MQKSSNAPARWIKRAAAAEQQAQTADAIQVFLDRQTAAAG